MQQVWELIQPSAAHFHLPHTHIALCMLIYSTLVHTTKSNNKTGTPYNLTQAVARSSVLNYIIKDFT